MAILNARYDSPSAAPVILLTGRPGTGKTTAIRHVVDALGDRAGGFYTREVRAVGRRTGFELVTLAGEAAVLAENAHPFEDPPFRMNNPFGQFELTS